MKYAGFYMLMFCLFLSCSETNKPTAEIQEKRPAYAMVIHGGAGVILREKMSPEKDSTYRIVLQSALDIGEKILSQGGSSTDAVLAVIQFLEDSPLFNAGRGSVFTHEEKNEMDASIMRGADMQAGAVGGLSVVKNPIMAAHAVLEHSDHVFLVGEGAETFAQEQGLEMVDPEYFRTEARLESLRRVKEREKGLGSSMQKTSTEKFGTVGCVALDKNGNIVAGTSTGGMTNKKYNRIGDSPVIGAGTYANNQTCGVSCTGHGEYFIRYAVAHDVSAIMEYKKLSVSDAADYVVNNKLKDVGGSGGLIALDHMGNIAMPFNTEGMYRAYVKPGERFVGIYKDENHQ